MENPFIITGKIKPEYFCDRQQEAKRIISKLSTGENIVLMANRRIGKSKLIDFCLDSPEIKNNFITISIDILRTSSIDEFVYILGKAVFEKAAHLGKKMLKMVTTTMKSISGKLGYDPIFGTPTFDLSLGDITNPTYTLEEIFSCLEQADMKCIVAIDEFQQISYYPEKNMEAILRTHTQNYSNANFIFSGSERHLITSMFTEKAHPFYNSADIMTLDVIPLDKYVSFAQSMFGKFEKTIEADVIEYVYDKFDGNTYYIQKVMHDIFNGSNYNISTDISTAKASIDSLILDNDTRFSEIMSRLSLPQKELLYAISKDGEARQITSAKFLKRHNLRSASSVQTAIKKLLDYHLVSISMGTYSIDDQLMKLWLEDFINRNNT